MKANYYRPHPKDGEGNIFTGVHIHGGYPHLAYRGVPPSQVRTGGYPLRRSGWQSTPSEVRTGGTAIFLMGGGVTPIWLIGVHPCWDWMGVPPSGLDGDTTLIDTGWDTPLIQTGSGTPLPIKRSGDRPVTRREVCILHSCKRTFLFLQ